MVKAKFYICEKCGNIVEMVKASGAPLVCCGQKMTEIKAGVVEASREKHIPVVEIKGNTVNVAVGSVEHPMTKEHSIEWIYLETDKGVHRKALEAEDAPKASFTLTDEKPIAVYAYCNLHGLWKAEI
ncbi:MAG: desulfoferrodoxin FeS4 iron-binding domain-containing protein [Clostridia bacterium]|nr:desulfoferrodoxin FeS4 iron-binding domain-containing protein [Clostridia bacterium]